MEGEDSGETLRDNKNTRRLEPVSAGMLPLEPQGDGRNLGGHHSIPCCDSSQGHASKVKHPPGHADFQSPKRTGREKWSISHEVQHLTPKIFETLSLTCTATLAICVVGQLMGTVAEMQVSI